MSTPQPPPIDWQHFWDRADHNAVPGPGDGYLAVVTYDGQPVGGPGHLNETERAELARLRGEIHGLRNRVFAVRAWHPGMPVPEGVDPADLEADYEIGKLARTRELYQSRDARADLDAASYTEPGPDECPATLSESLRRPRPPQRWMIEGLWGQRHNVSIEALYKTGKSTFTGSLLGSYADSTPFLGFWPVHPHEGRTAAVWNTEMDGDDFDDYLAAHVRNTDRVVPAHLQHRPVALLTSARAWTVRWLRSAHAGLWLVDSWTRLCAWCGVDPIDNFAVSKLTAVLDEIKGEAGTEALGVTAHMPHAAKTDRAFERGIGAQTFSGWADVLVRLTRDEQDNRFMAADGRKVSLSECRVVMMPDGTLRVFAGNRGGGAAVSPDEVSAAVLDRIRRHPGIGQNQIEKDLADLGRNSVRKALRDLETSGKLMTTDGKNNARHHYLTGTDEYMRRFQEG